MTAEPEEFTALGLLAKLYKVKPPPRVSRRRFDRSLQKDPEAKELLRQEDEKLSRLIAFSTKVSLPPCPRCGSKLFFEMESITDSRLVCFSGRHTTEVIRISGTTFWVRRDFFQAE